MAKWWQRCGSHGGQFIHRTFSRVTPLPWTRLVVISYTSVWDVNAYMSWQYQPGIPGSFLLNHPIRNSALMLWAVLPVSCAMLILGDITTLEFGTLPLCQCRRGTIGH
ncbi:hypothetical protein BD410DRAFT_504905 [Rickenella mellea]|uniref:Uncharacterized protein n=1 Tax=Rickenella mellea TaxID=50990 RepID=A0A4Y7PSA9_9AGAM|nr:hypothetical protein BD410DRAFT_504905 [Rickenella mellea]